MYILLPHDSRWGFVCGRIAAIEGRRVSREALVQALTAPAGEAIRQCCAQVLAAHETYLPESAPWYDRIDSAYRARIRSVRDDSPHPEVADIFLLAGEYLNLGRRLRGEAPNLFNGGDVPNVVALDEQVDLTRLPEAVQSLVGSAVEEGNPSRLALILDSAYLRHLLELARLTGSSAIAAWMLDWVLAQCVSSLFRLSARGAIGADDLKKALTEPVFEELFRRFASSAGTEIAGLSSDLSSVAKAVVELPLPQRATEFERLALVHLLRAIAASQCQTAGPERVFGFLFSLMVEQRNVRLILWGRIAERPAPSLRQQLCFADGMGAPEMAGQTGGTSP